MEKPETEDACESAQLPRTDLRRWRLRCIEGVHNWQYLSEDEASPAPQSFAEKYFLGLPIVSLAAALASCQSIAQN